MNNFRLIIPLLCGLGYTQGTLLNKTPLEEGQGRELHVHCILVNGDTILDGLVNADMFVGDLINTLNKGGCDNNQLLFDTNILDPNKPLGEQIPIISGTIQLNLVRMSNPLEGLNLVEYNSDHPLVVPFIDDTIRMVNKHGDQFDVPIRAQNRDFATQFALCMFSPLISHRTNPRLRSRYEQCWRGLLQNPNYADEDNLLDSLSYTEFSSGPLACTEFLKSVLEGAEVPKAAEPYTTVVQIESALQARLTRDGVTDDDIMNSVQLLDAFLRSETFHRLFIKPVRPHEP